MGHAGTFPDFTRLSSIIMRQRNDTIRILDYYHTLNLLPWRLYRCSIEVDIREPYHTIVWLVQLQYFHTARATLNEDKFRKYNMLPVYRLIILHAKKLRDLHLIISIAYWNEYKIYD